MFIKFRNVFLWNHFLKSVYLYVIINVNPLIDKIYIPVDILIIKFIDVHIFIQKDNFIKV